MGCRMAEKERNEFGWRSKAEIQQAKSRPEWRSFVCDTRHGKEGRGTVRKLLWQQ